MSHILLFFLISLNIVRENTFLLSTEAEKRSIHGNRVEKMHKERINKWREIM